MNSNARSTLSSHDSGVCEKKREHFREIFPIDFGLNFEKIDMSLRDAVSRRIAVRVLLGDSSPPSTQERRYTPEGKNAVN